MHPRSGVWVWPPLRSVSVAVWPPLRPVGVAQKNKPSTMLPSNVQPTGLLMDFSGVTKGDKGGDLPPGTALWGRQIEVGMIRTNYGMSNVCGC